MPHFAVQTKLERVPFMFLAPHVFELKKGIFDLKTRMLLRGSVWHFSSLGFCAVADATRMQPPQHRILC
jgi:hypothetical protein